MAAQTLHAKPDCASGSTGGSFSSPSWAFRSRTDPAKRRSRDSRAPQKIRKCQIMLVLRFDRNQIKGLPALICAAPSSRSIPTPPYSQLSQASRAQLYISKSRSTQRSSARQFQDGKSKSAQGPSSVGARSTSWLTLPLTMQPALPTEIKDALVLRLKYHKTTLFLPCQPSTLVSSLKSDFLTAVRSTNQAELSTLPQYAQPDGKSYPEWSQMDPEEDIGLFIASSTGADETMTIYMPLDQDTAQSDLTVRKAGLKDADAVCVGFRAQGACKYSPPPALLTSRPRLLTMPPVRIQLVSCGHYSFDLATNCTVHRRRRGRRRSCRS